MVDELDKMDSEDRSALHECMEQGTISVAKAGITTRFKTDTSILAAANPKFSRFDPSENFLMQIDLPSSLLSRFDLFFMIRDVLDRKRDEETTRHIIQTHVAGEIKMYQKQSGRKSNRADADDLKKIVEPEIRIELLKKYISYARQNIFPILEKEAEQAISEYYVNLREKGKKEGAYSATPRQLEGIIRLSEASARVRLSESQRKGQAFYQLRVIEKKISDAKKRLNKVKFKGRRAKKYQNELRRLEEKQSQILEKVVEEEAPEETKEEFIPIIQTKICIYATGKFTDGKTVSFRVNADIEYTNGYETDLINIVNEKILEAIIEEDENFQNLDTLEIEKIEDLGDLSFEKMVGF